jgi:hypothetical protein
MSSKVSGGSTSAMVEAIHSVTRSWSIPSTPVSALGRPAPIN